MSNREDLYTILEEEAKDFYLVENIERISKPTPLEFYRDYVSQNRPVIITGALDDWDALVKWKDDDYLCELMKDTKVTVAVTPDGLGDAVKGDLFVKPYEMKLTFKEYFQLLDNQKQCKSTKDKRVYYIQYQNDSFNVEFQNLWKDIKHSNVSFAKEAFGLESDAVNFWMGGNESVSSLHKDPYENIYCVVRGSKLFTLIPPIDYPFLYEKEYKSATYDKDMNIQIDEPPMNVPWIPVDPCQSLEVNESLGYLEIKRAHPLHIQVNEGEILYLPSLYYHRVAQYSPTNKTIAINYWFDMKYGLNYVYFQFLKEYHKQNQKQ
ncbi:transcription factor jumonji [Tieghemostelium lacteum]|uniref:Transcription factor jumonji n=1 Tax=Tieghemostelium lacteum TaxID=361077 RepID=A0A152A516_TIELA|nr:transcription factor jumonji [Tieghemostelium lacteum]|eukprot:KYR01333.1 transcription factor jumonji [Tieghemostelium lacteum]